MIGTFVVGLVVCFTLGTWFYVVIRLPWAQAPATHRRRIKRKRKHKPDEDALWFHVMQVAGMIVPAILGNLGFFPTLMVVLMTLQVVAYFAAGFIGLFLVTADLPSEDDSTRQHGEYE